MTKIPGEFVPLDVDAMHDRALRQAGPMAELLFYRGLQWCRKHKTGGSIQDYDLASVAAGIPNPKRHADALVRERAWMTEKTGWRIRSWAKWNPEADHGKQSAGGKLGNHNKWHIDGKWSPDCDFCTPPPTDGDDPHGIGTESPTDRPTDIATESVGDRFSSQKEKEKERESEGRSSSSQSHLGNARGALALVPELGEKR